MLVAVREQYTMTYFLLVMGYAETILLSKIAELTLLLMKLDTACKPNVNTTHILFFVGQDEGVWHKER